MAERPPWSDLDQVELHLTGSLSRIDIPFVRGQPVASYLAADASGLPRRMTIILTSFGFGRRTGLLLKSLDGQLGVRADQVEVRCVADAALVTDGRPWLHVETAPADDRKARWLHRLAGDATGDVLVFTDGDALFPPWFCANVLQLVRAEKLHTSVRKDLPFHLAEVILDRQSGLEGLDWAGMRDAIPDRWSYDWIRRTPSGYLHVLSADLYWRVGGYPTDHVGYDEYDWDFATRVFAATGEPILVPDLWSIHLGHPRGEGRAAWFATGRDL